MRRLFTFALITALTIAALTLPDSTLAQDNEIRVLSHRVETNFPTSVSFYVEVAGPEEIRDIRVYLKTIGQTSRSAYRQVEFEPGREVGGDAELLTSGNNYVPPGTRMAYYFEVTDAAGRSLRTEEEIFVYLDSRFEWHTVSAGIITVYYNNPLVLSRARHVLETAMDTLERMGPVLGINPELPLHIVTYHNYREMAFALPFRSQTTQENLITAGMAFDEERVLLVYSGSQGVTGTTAHEFTHLLVGDALGPAYSRVPAWLNEGLAEYGASERPDGFSNSLRRGIEAGKVRPLWHHGAGAFSGTPEDILIGYGQGESVVYYLVEAYGKDKMADLMQAITETLEVDEALKQVYGISVYELDAAWREAMGIPPLPDPQGSGAGQHPAPRPTLPPQPTLALMGLPQANPTATPTAPTAQTAAPAATATRTPTPEPAPATATATAPAPPAEDGQARLNAGDSAGEVDEPEPAAPAPASGGCNAPPMQSGASGEMGLMLLLVSPASLLLAVKGWRRRLRGLVR